MPIPMWFILLFSNAFLCSTYFNVYLFWGTRRQSAASTAVPSGQSLRNTPSSTRRLKRSPPLLSWKISSFKWLLAGSIKFEIRITGGRFRVLPSPFPGFRLPRLLYSGMFPLWRGARPFCGRSGAGRRTI